MIKPVAADPQESALVEPEFRKVGEVEMVIEERPLPVRWIAESDDGVVGAVDRTSRGKYRATNIDGRRLGTYRTLTEAREQLAKKHDSTAIQRMDQSRVLVIGGLIALLATVAIAVVGVILLLAL